MVSRKNVATALALTAFLNSAAAGARPGNAEMLEDLADRGLLAKLNATKVDGSEGIIYIGPGNYEFYINKRGEVVKRYIGEDGGVYDARVFDAHGNLDMHPKPTRAALAATETATPTQQYSNTPTNTRTRTPTGTATPPTHTYTPTGTPTRSPTYSATPTAPPTDSPTPYDTPTSPPTNSPLPTDSPTPYNSPTETPTPDMGMKGDINNDGRITTTDALLCFEIALGIHTPTPEEAWRADANGDGRVSTADALCIFEQVLSMPNQCFGSGTPTAAGEAATGTGTRKPTRSGASPTGTSCEYDGRQYTKVQAYENGNVLLLGKDGIVLLVNPEGEYGIARGIMPAESITDLVRAHQPISTPADRNRLGMGYAADRNKISQKQPGSTGHRYKGRGR